MNATADSCALTLTLLRHAKSSWRDPDATDHERTLNKRGRHDSPIMARRLVQSGLPVEQVLCSDARRTRETAELVLPYLESTSRPLILDPRIYEASVGDLITVISEQSASSLLLIGHNPGLELLCQTLAPDQVSHMPTCSIAAFGFAADGWAAALEDAATRGNADLLLHDYPKRVPEQPVVE